MDDPLDSVEGGLDENEDEGKEKGDGDAGRFVPAEQRVTVDSSRRSGDERRQDEESFKGDEKRESSERRGEIDRREMGLNVTCRTTGAVSSVEDWLDENCHNDWNVVLDKIDDDMITKSLTVMFDTEEDRDIFLDRYLNVAK